MAEKEISNIIKLQIEAGKASPAPPVGPALGSSGVNIMQFVKEFNDRTANQPGMIIPVVITVYKDKSFTFITKVPPVAVLIKKAIKQNNGAKGAAAAAGGPLQRPPAELRIHPKISLQIFSYFIFIFEILFALLYRKLIF